jgi:phenylalanine-4-hydroxylase
MDKPGSAHSSSGLRGDYSRAGADFAVEQDWASYTPAMHDRWRRLYARQSALCQIHAAPQFLAGLHRLDCAGGIPDFVAANRVIAAATGWTLVAVPGFIPDDAFFDHLANRRFPVCRWLREEHELDYLVEPDVFHDFLGHVPLLLDPVFADFLQLYGKAGARAMMMDALPMLARVYWYTVEFGLIATPGGLKAFGAGIVSSAGETVFSTTDPHVLRLCFDPVRIMRTAYMIDDFQMTYFVIDSLEQLMRGLVDLDFAPVYERWRHAPPIPAGATVPGDAIWQPVSLARTA